MTDTPWTPEATFARRMREQRRANGMTQVDLARRLSEHLGVRLDATAITKIETGVRSVRLDEVVYIARILDVQIWTLVSELDPVDARMEELLHGLEKQEARAAAALREHKDALGRIKHISDEIDEIDAVIRRAQSEAAGADGTTG